MAKVLEFLLGPGEKSEELDFWEEYIRREFSEYPSQFRCELLEKMSESMSYDKDTISEVKHDIVLDVILSDLNLIGERNEDVLIVTPSSYISDGEKRKLCDAILLYGSGLNVALELKSGRGNHKKDRIKGREQLENTLKFLKNSYRGTKEDYGKLIFAGRRKIFYETYEGKYFTKKYLMRKILKRENSYKNPQETNWN